MPLLHLKPITLFRLFLLELALISLPLCASNADASLSEASTEGAHYEYDYEEVGQLFPNQFNQKEGLYPQNFPYRIGLIYDVPLDSSLSWWEQDASLLYTYLYQGNQLVQKLNTHSEYRLTPFFDDFNFDGYSDLAIALYHSNNPSLSYEYWLYNPKTKLFDYAPDSLQMVLDPIVDEERQQLVSFWRASALSQGYDIYQWKDSEVVLVDQVASYFLPIKIEGELFSCYNTPFYHTDGEILHTLALVKSNNMLQKYQLMAWDFDSLKYMLLTPTALKQITEECYDFINSAPSPHLETWTQAADGTLQHQADFFSQPVEKQQIVADNVKKECYFLNRPYYNPKTYSIEWLIDREHRLCNVLTGEANQ